jgi:uncharacterized protein YmfQ (DUF2313 family)
MYSEKFLKLSKQLFPTGLAFKMSEGSYLEKFNLALAHGKSRVYEDAISILNAILPDNANFTEEDATAWERRLGLITNPLVSLEDRKKAILRKMNHPGTIPARQHYLYLQQQLQLAGFDVYVHENIPAVDPIEAIIDVGFGPHGEILHGDDVFHGDSFSVYADLYQYVEHGMIEHGEANHGEYFFKNKVVNHLSASDDLTFSVGDNYKASFFIGGETKGTFANVDAERETEFRQLILKIKPVQTVAFLFINYI